MISYLLLCKILHFFAVLVLGFLLVKLKILKSSDSSVLSKISLYLLMPSAIINAFNIENFSGEIAQGFILAFIVAIIVHILLMFIDFIYKKVFKAGVVERASVVYSNAANMIIPIISFVLGDEWVIYSTAFISIQLIFVWTHGITLFRSDEKFNIKKILLNINIIAIAIGFIIMISGVKIPQGVTGVLSSLGGMMGDVGMLIAGMLAAQVNYKEIIKRKRLYVAVLMRMVVCPAIMLILIKTIMLFVHINNADKILLISFLACITPTAATIFQLSQIHNEDVDFAVAINVVTTLVCVVTMPIFVSLL